VLVGVSAFYQSGWSRRTDGARDGPIVSSATLRRVSL
jgi:hypothetical protein